MKSLPYSTSKTNRSNSFIEWLVAIAVAYATTFTILESFFDEFFPLLRSVSGIMRGVIVLLMLFSQIRHYGLHIREKSFFIFFLTYNLFLVIYLLVFPKYKLEDLHGVPGAMSGSTFAFFYRSVQVVGYILSAELIIRHLSVKKYILVSFFSAVIPSISFIQYLGVDTIQYLNDFEDEAFSILALGYCNSTILVLEVLFFKKFIREGLVSSAFMCVVIISVLYILFVGGERGPLIWAMMNLLICLFLLSKNTVRYCIYVAVLGILLYVNIDVILEIIKPYAPRAAEKIELTVIEGDTSGRFDMDNQEGSTYIIGLKQFASSPIYGSYFRMVTNHRTFRGHYPHNVFIEMLITMGLLGTIPFILLLFKAYKKVYKVIKRGDMQDSQLCCLAIFLGVFLQLQTTWSIVANAAFWTFFYIMCIFDTKIAERKTNKVFRNKNNYNR